MMTTEIKPCPHCGGSDITVHAGETFKWMFAFCRGCATRAGEVRVQTSGSGTREEWATKGARDAFAEWNRRVEATPFAASRAAPADSRAAFESHFIKLTGTRPVTWAYADAAGLLSDERRDKYLCLHEQLAWECWQAALASREASPAVSKAATPSEVSQYAGMDGTANDYQAVPHIAPPAPSANPKLLKAYELGFVCAAKWANRDDLREDLGSKAFADDRDRYLRPMLDPATQPASPAPLTDDDLHKFLDAAGGEGLVLGGVDAGDLYVKLFPYRCGAALASPQVAPIDMVLHCPKCHMQHIDAPHDSKYLGPLMEETGFAGDWENPPHRSHLCHGCGHIWRPADVPTNGVAAVSTTGKADSPIAAPVQVAPAPERAIDAHSISALRWLLNITTEFDRKDVRTRQAARLLDECGSGEPHRTNREWLEDLWKAVAAPVPTPAAADDARDAARYRWLMDSEWEMFDNRWLNQANLYGEGPKEFGEFIDAQTPLTLPAAKPAEPTLPTQGDAK